MKQWQSYEDLVRNIYEKLGHARGVSILGHGAKCRVKGKSGVEHQLDVLTGHSDGVHTYRTAIECKHWKDKVQKDSVAKLAEILEDAQIEKGVVVSKAGFTADAVAFAKYKNISLVTLAEPTEEFWADRIKDIHINFQVMSSDITDFVLNQSSGATTAQRPVTAQSDDMVFVSVARSFSAHEVLQEELAKNEWQARDVTPCEVVFPAGTKLTVRGTDIEVMVRSVQFNIRRRIHESKIELRGEDFVSMVMESLFDQKRFVIDHTGDVRPTA